jgi:hypothetical protein
MARIEGVAKGRESWLLRFANRFSRGKLGAEVEPTAIMGHHTWILAGVGAMEMALERATRLPAQLKLLVDIKAAMQVGCPF